MKTYSPKPHDIERRWFVIDAKGQVLGRLASQVATILRGKHKPIFAPHMDTGDHVVVVNAREVVLTGGKEEKKVYVRHSGYPGGLRTMNYTRLLALRPALAVEKAVWGMLPKNRLGRQMFRKLAVYEGGEHVHQAQKPIALAPGELPKWEGLPKTPVATPRRRSAPKREKMKAEPAERPEPPARRRRALTPGRTASKKAPAKPGATRGRAEKPAAKTTAGGRRTSARAGKAAAPAKTSRSAKSAKKKKES